MAKTFNRKPLSVSTSNSSDYQFFNQYEFKGIDNSKNFLTVDQETFEDAQNVYVNEDGILASRPPLLKFKGLPNDLENVTAIKEYENLLITLNLNDSNNYDLRILEKEGDHYVNKYIHSNFTTRNKILFYSSSEGMYFFNDTDIYFYNRFEQTFTYPQLYTPVTKLFAPGNVEEEIESENLFGNLNRYDYLVDQDFNINTAAYGQYLSYDYEIDGVKGTRNIVVDSDYFYKLQFEFFNLEDANYQNTQLPDQRLFMAISDLGQMAIYSRNTKSLLYSSDGIIFELSSILESNETINRIKFSHNGELVLLFSDTGVYGLSVLVSEESGTILYPKLVKILDCETFLCADFESSARYAYWGRKLEESPDLRICYVLPESLYPYSKQEIYPPSEYQVDLDMLLILGPCVNKDSIGTIIIYTTGRYESQDNGAPGKPTGYLVYDIPSDGSIEGVDKMQINMGHLPHRAFFDGSVSDRVLRLVFCDDSYWYLVINDYSGEEFVQSRYRGSRINPVSDNENQVYKDPQVSISKNSVYIGVDSTLYNMNSGEYIDFIDLAHNPMIYKVTDKYVYFYDPYAPERIYSNKLINSVTLYKTESKPSEYIGIDFIDSLSDIFLTKSANLYIGKEIEKDNVKYLYFPKNNKNVFSSNLKALHPISKNEMALFFTDEIWYATYQENSYYYVKSKLQPNIKNESDILTGYDSTSIFFPSKQGLILLNYQDFIASSEMKTVELSYPIRQLYNQFNSSVRLCKFKDYVFLCSNSKTVLVFDTRNSSWWKWVLPVTVCEIRVIDEELYVITESKYVGRFVDNDIYLDNMDGVFDIEWYFKSQKLHLGFPNDYKHISNITLQSVQANNNPLRLILNVSNYRKDLTEGKTENFEYSIDFIRTFVKRLNYGKICEFQYSLRYDDVENLHHRLMLTGLSIKYKLGGQIR